jgi:hypothetical protein
MNIVDQAINFAAMAHNGQTRKSTSIPYISHPFAVGMLLQKMKCAEEVIAAGILHDTLEDTSTTFEDLAQHFGIRVAKLVLAASEEDKSLPWKERKQHTIDGLPDAYAEEIQIIIADKLHNLRSIRTDIEVNGENVWDRFNRGKRDQHWYYSSIVKALIPRKKECKLIGELEREVKAVFGTLETITKEDISFLFSCVYGVNNRLNDSTGNDELIEMAKELFNYGNRIHDEEYNEVTTKLDDLSLKGIEFQSNSDGPFMIASYSIALQRKMNWTDQEIFKHIKRNLYQL